ncbi:MAG: hypothetical protein EOM24_03245 [Chloroflexia bacterium]|nr:hypothetical protein [Chloroflexia bacterium]
MNQQCWYWGCDVRHPERNLLLAYGFDRMPPPKGVAGSTMYTLAPDPGVQVILWSFGVFCGREGAGGLLLNRFRFEPLWTDHAPLASAIWRPEQLPALSWANDANRRGLTTLFGDLLHWVIAYEQTILAVQGLTYREHCLAQWNRRRLGLPADALIPAWQNLAEAIHTSSTGAANELKET